MLKNTKNTMRIFTGEHHKYTLFCANKIILICFKTNMNVNKKAIGIFDSGLGGLTVLKELKQRLPNEFFIYFGDIKNLPYGNKSNPLILNYSYKISNNFIRHFPVVYSLC